MNVSQNPGSSRREFLKNTGRVAAVSALAGVDLPHVHAAESNTIQVALVGCGGRGTGAAANALATKSGPIKLVAMADVFQQRLEASYEAASTGGDASDVAPDRRVGGLIEPEVDVPPDRRFLGFDAYQKAMDCLRPGDVVILATPRAFRWVHFTLRDREGPATSSWRSRSPSTGRRTRKMLALGEEVEEEEPQGRRRPDVPPLRGAPGAARSDPGRRRSATSSRCGPIGQTGPVGSVSAGPKPDGYQRAACTRSSKFHELPLGQRRLLQRLPDPQHRRMLLDEGLLAGCRPRARAAATTAATTSIRTSTPTRSNTRSPTARKLFLEGRNIAGCYQEFASYAHGTKGSAVISTDMHTPAKCRIYKGQNL